MTPGLFGRVRLQGSSPYQAVLVPDEAVGSDQAQKYVFVMNGDNMIEYRAVQLGPLIHGFRVIRSGLRPNELFVANGIQRARAGIKVTPEKRAITATDVDFLSPASSAARSQPKPS